MEHVYPEKVYQEEEQLKHVYCRPHCWTRRVVTLNSAAYEHSCFVLVQRRR